MRGPTRPDPTRPHDVFEKLISLERADRFTSGLLCSMSPFNKFRMDRGGVRSASARAHVHTRFPDLANGWADCVQIWCVARDPLDKCFTHV